MTQQATYILGLNAHRGDSSAALIKDGVLVAAAEEERIRRIKHWAGFPSEAIRYCLSEAGIALEQVVHVALNQSAGMALRRPHADLLADLAAEVRLGRFHGSVHQVEHQLAH